MIRQALIRLAAIALTTATFAAAQDVNAVRRIVISIPDRKLVLFEGDRLIKI